MLRHDDVAVNAQSEAAAHVFQALNQQIVGFGAAEIGLPAVTTEGEEVGLAGLLETSQATGHKENLHPRPPEYMGPRLAPKKRARTWGTRL